MVNLCGRNSGRENRESDSTSLSAIPCSLEIVTEIEQRPVPLPSRDELGRFRQKPELMELPNVAKYSGTSQTRKPASRRRRSGAADALAELPRGLSGRRYVPREPFGSSRPGAAT
jgi:hypothetical protein